MNKFIPQIISNHIFRQVYPNKYLIWKVSKNIVLATLFLSFAGFGPLWGK